jgi:hypothetical protein
MQSKLVDPRVLSHRAPCVVGEAPGPLLSPAGVHRQEVATSQPMRCATRCGNVAVRRVRSDPAQGAPPPGDCAVRWISQRLAGVQPRQQPSSK